VNSDSGPIRNWHQIACELLLSEADHALLLLVSLVTWDDPDVVARTVERAKGAYEDILRKREGLTMSKKQTAALQAKLDQLQSQLRSLGEAV
jgi:septal ring factor EnvC (AmiA/AmiB activator)